MPTAPILLDDIIRKAGPLLDLAQGRYQLLQTALVQRPLEIRANGSTLIAPVQHAAFDAHAPVILSGWNCSHANAFLHVAPGTHGCRLDTCWLNDVLNAVMVEDGGGLVECENTTAKSRSVTYYGTIGLTNCAGSSTGEYAIRFEGRGQSYVNGGRFTNAQNTFGKDTIGARNGNAKLDSVKVSGNLRAGQNPPNTPPNPPPVPGQYTTISMTRCIFDLQSPGHSYLEILQGAILYEWSNTWQPAKNPDIAGPGEGSLLYHHAP